MTQVELVLDHMMFGATCGIWIAAAPRTSWIVKAGQYSMPSLDGRTMLLVRIALLSFIIGGRFCRDAHKCSFIPAVGSVLAYVFYWIAVVAVLVYMKFKEVSSAVVHFHHICLTQFPHRAARKFSAASQQRVCDGAKTELRGIWLKGSWTTKSSFRSDKSTIVVLLTFSLLIRLRPEPQT